MSWADGEAQGTFRHCVHNANSRSYAGQCVPYAYQVRLNASLVLSIRGLAGRRGTKRYFASPVRTT